MIVYEFTISLVEIEYILNFHPLSNWCELSISLH